MPRRGRPPSDWESRFFEAFAVCGDIGWAARAAGVSPRTVHRRRESDDPFDARFTEIADEFYDRLLEALWVLAMQEGSGTAIRFILQLLRPEQYGPAPGKRYAARRPAPVGHHPGVVQEIPAEDHTPMETSAPAAWRGPVRHRVRARRGWEPRFLAVLAETRNVRAACEAANVSRSAVYKKRDRDQAFAAGWDDALTAAPVPILPQEPRTATRMYRALLHVPHSGRKARGTLVA